MNLNQKASTYVFLCAKISGWIQTWCYSEKNFGSYGIKNYIFNKNTFSTDDDNCCKLLRQLKMSLPFSHQSDSPRLPDTCLGHLTPTQQTTQLRVTQRCSGTFTCVTQRRCGSNRSQTRKWAAVFGCCWHLQSLINKTGIIIKRLHCPWICTHSGAGIWWAGVNI